jgi:regulator of replication initiation timing
MEQLEYQKVINNLIEENSKLKKEKENLISMLSELTITMKWVYSQAIEEIFECKESKNGL